MRRRSLIFLAAVLLCGCYPYKVVVEQGNLLDKQDVAKLHPNMSKEEVVARLGSPVIDGGILNRDRWIYGYTKRDSRGRDTANHRLVLEFKNNRLVKINR